MQPDLTNSLRNVEPAIEPNYVRTVGDTIGVVNLTPNATQLVADQVTRILAKLIRESKNYTVHGRRHRMLAEDLEPVISSMNITKPIGHCHRSNLRLRHVPVSGGEDLFVNDDFEVDLANMTESNPVKLPIKTHIRAHWLTIDGKLVAAPENVRIASEEEECKHECDEKAASISSRRETAGGAQGASVSFRASSRLVSTKEQIYVKTPVNESLSVEQQLYLKQIVESCVGQEEEFRKGAITSLETDTGLIVLLPKLTRLIFNSIRCNIIHRCLSMLIYIVRMVRALSLNPSLHLQPYLHELVPSLVSCMVGRQLSARPEDNHWALRDFAAKTLCKLVKDHGVLDTRDRVIKSVRKIWDDPNSSFPSLFGCLYPLADLTTPYQKAEILPRIQELIERSSEYHHLMKDTIEYNELRKVNEQLLKIEMVFRNAHHSQIVSERKPNPI